MPGRYRTLGELRAELLARLGMGAMGASGGANSVLIDSFLRNGQAQLYRAQDWRHLTAYADITTGVGQNQYDYPNACERDQRVLRVEVQQSGLWTPLCEGIETGMWSTMDTQSIPTRYERFAQLLIYPKSDAAYTLRVWYVADLGRFTQASDESTLDDEMVLLHALANAKAHYRQPDAATYQGQLNSLLGQLRGDSFGSNRVYRRGNAAEPERKPALLGRDA
jgi:hypothetical protein